MKRRMHGDEAPTTSSGLNAPPGLGGAVLVATDAGPVPAGWLRVGDRVLTRDMGFQPVLWRGRITISADAMELDPGLRPVEMAGGTATVAPGQGVLLRGAAVALHFGATEASAQAGALCDHPLVCRAAISDFVFHLVMLPAPEMIAAGGLWLDTLDPGEPAICGPVPLPDRRAPCAARTRLEPWQARLVAREAALATSGRGARSGSLAEPLPPILPGNEEDATCPMEAKSSRGRMPTTMR